MALSLHTGRSRDIGAGQRPGVEIVCVLDSAGIMETGYHYPRPLVLAQKCGSYVYLSLRPNNMLITSPPINGYAHDEKLSPSLFLPY